MAKIMQIHVARMAGVCTVGGFYVAAAWEDS